MIYLKKSGYIVLISLVLGCGPRYQYDPNKNRDGRSIIDIEYINDTLDLNLVDFRVKKLGTEDYELSIYIISQSSEEYFKNHRFYAHFYPYKDSVGPNTSFFPLGTNNTERMGDTIMYKRMFSSRIKSFEKVRYGLEDPKGERLFNLRIDSVNFR